MVSNPHLSAALTCVAIRRLLADAMARSNRRRRRLRRILAMCQWQDHGWGQDIEVLVLLYSLAHGLSLSVVGSAFGIPKSTVHRIIKHVTGKIKANLKTLISLPTADELPEIADGFCQLAKSPAFHRAAGAIDGCHIRIKPPGNEYHKEYINYKLFPSIQMPSVTQLGDSWMSSSAIQALFMMPEYCETAPSSARHFPQLVGSSLGTVVIPAWKNQWDYSHPTRSLTARCRPDSTGIMPGLGLWGKEHLEG
ncbi:uncharacterized protein [Pseudochaenichthys georgianus]|uniref:uncharacterized protein n=1 Tax=Pseudochaenichthys georgianus TaxID=52239 RepID=UPI0039C3FC4C